MNLSAKSNYKATIPAQSDTSKISYYIVAQDTTGKTAQVPTMGQADPYIFYSIKNASAKTLVVAQESVKMYPNPNNGRFYLWIDVVQNQDVNIAIFSTDGKLVFNETRNINSNGQLVNIDASYLKSGIYMVKMISKTNVITQKLIVK